MAVLFITFIVGITVITSAASSEPILRRELSSQGQVSVHSMEKRITRHAGQSNGSAFPIDVVYCWSGQALQQQGDSDHNEGGGFGELRYSIRFLEAYAPWFNKAFVMVNTPAMDRPPWLSEESKDKIVMIDRCSLLNDASSFDDFNMAPQNCPTENTQACQAVAHKIPGLSEHFMIMDDDFLLLHPLNPSDFFQSSDNPLVIAAVSEQDVPMYDHTPQGPDMPPNLTPTRMASFHHVPLPMLVSFASQLEDTYPDWYAFVRSHRTRFVCCNATIRGNGLDEDFKRIYPHMLLKLKVGSPQPQNHPTVCDSARKGGELSVRELAFQKCFEANLLDSQLKFMTLQNIGKLSTWRIVQKALEEHIKDMPKSKLVVPAPLPSSMFVRQDDFFGSITFER